VALAKRQWMQLIGFCLAAVGGMIALAGCTGTAYKNETAARQDLEAVRARYRPQEARPLLPVLTEKSGLPDLIHYAVLNNPRAESMFYDWSAAVEKITVDRSLPNPMLSFGATISSGLPTLSASLMSDPGMNWPGPGKLPLKADAATAESERFRNLFENELLATALAVKRAYYQMWVLEEQIRWTRATLALVDQDEAIARQRMVAGKAGEQDVLKVQMERDRLGAQLANLEDSRAPLQARLKSALGLRPDAAMPKFTLGLDPQAANLTEASLLATAFERNPQLKAARSEVLQALALFHLSEKTVVPDYSWGVGASVGAGMPVSVMPSFGFSLPVWRDKIAAEIAQGRGNLSAAEARAAAEELDLAVRFAETAYAWREADRNATLYGSKLLPKARAALDAARAAYVAGTAGFADVLEAERTLLEIHTDYAMAAGQREIALAEMSLSILGRWPEQVPGLLPEAPAKEHP
jgi:outer membrane protein, heavy metal efflux system